MLTPEGHSQVDPSKSQTDEGSFKGYACKIRMDTSNLASAPTSFDLSATTSQLESLGLSRRIAMLGNLKTDFPPK